MRRSLFVLLTLGSVMLAPAAVAAPRAARCALGRTSTANATIEGRARAAAQARFERSLTGVSAAQKSAAGAHFATDLAAYVYGYPIVIIRRTILTFPRNRMISIGRLANPSTQTVVAPNHDTLYSVAQVDLSDGPVVVHTPSGGGRYSVIQLLDGFTNVVAYVGDGRAARTGETAAIVPPGWHGPLPAGVRLERSATKLVWLLGRTLATGTADTAAATKLLARYSVEPLSAYLAGTRNPPLILPDFPGRPPVNVPTGTSFFDELGADLAADPPPARDACALRAFAAAGVGAGRTASMLSGLNATALTAAAQAGRGVLNTIVQDVRQLPARGLNGWTTPPDTARFGTDYLDRGLVGEIALGANTNAKALYLTEGRDSSGRALSGAHTYTVHFKRGELPPVGQFWSLTLYDSRILFYANPLDRYALGDRSVGLRNDAHGGLTIIVSHRDPGLARRGNWLPAPPGSFLLYLRLYEPKPAAIDRRWVPPSVVRVR